MARNIKCDLTSCTLTTCTNLLWIGESNSPNLIQHRDLHFRFQLHPFYFLYPFTSTGFHVWITPGLPLISSALLTHFLFLCHPIIYPIISIQSGQHPDGPKCMHWEATECCPLNTMWRATSARQGKAWSRCHLGMVLVKGQELPLLYVWEGWQSCQVCFPH